jgi:GT2 family glycosyltransferase
VQVSFIIPLYDCLPLTQAMVASLQATVPRDLAHEIILVDDGSTDGTRAWLATLAAPFRVILNERNLGYAVANNRGAAAARGDVLALLNNDLVLASRWLEPMLALHRRLGTQAGLVGNVQLDARSGQVDHAGIFINSKGKPEHERSLPSWSWLPERSWRPADAVTGACALVGRELWGELGGFDEGYINGCEDVDLCLRARAARRVNAVVLASVVRHHVSSSSGRKLRNEENTWRLTRRWRRELAGCGVRRWCRDCWEGSLFLPLDRQPLLALRCWLYVHGLRPAPPPEALAAMDAAIAVELARWEEMFGRTSAGSASRPVE